MLSGMAPYLGPSLAALIPLVRKGLRDSVTLGSGLPRAPLYFRDGAFELHRLSGGEGFGVQPDLVRPFVDEGLLVRAVTWQELIAWLCEHWDAASWGEPLGRDQQLRLTFTDGKTLVAATLEVAAGACRAARAANAAVDFDVIRGKQRSR
jgi:hypothetical protein